MPVRLNSTKKSEFVTKYFEKFLDEKKYDWVSKSIIEKGYEFDEIIKDEPSKDCLASLYGVVKNLGGFREVIAE